MASKWPLVLLALMVMSQTQANPVPGDTPGTTVPTTTVAPDDDRKAYRLPLTVTPSHYQIDLSTKLREEDNFPLTGKTAITITASEKVDDVILHSVGLVYSKIQIKDSAATDDTFRSLRWKTNETLQQLKVLGASLKTGKEYVLSFTHSGVLSDDMQGFYKSKYTNAAGEEKWLAATQFEPTFARRAFPCFDEPQFKAKFTISVTTEREYVATLSNSVEEFSTHNDDDTFTTTFQETVVPLPTYLIALVISDFSSETSFDEKKREFRVFTRDEAVNQTTLALQVAVPLLNKMEELTEVTYDNKKMHLVAIPDFSAGAMENWGLVTFREADLLFHDNDSSTAAKQSVTTVVAHEFSHMWFGDMVTLDWWSNLWLNEGFADYCQYHLTNQVYPEMELDRQFVIEELHAALELDGIKSTKPMSADVVTVAEIQDHFDTVSYNKGGSVLRMMEHALTTEVFVKGLRKYLADNKGQNGSPDKLFAALQQFADPKLNVAQLMQSYTTQSGYPVIQVSPGSGLYVNIKQDRFLYQADEKAKQYWYVPISYVTKGDGVDGFNDTKYSVLLANNDDILGHQIKLKNEDDWIIFNVQQTGYYRVWYHEDLLKRIVSELKEHPDRIHELNRAQLIDDSFNLARAGLYTYDQVFEVIDYLNTETNYYPWSAAFNSYAYVLRRLQANSEAMDYAKRYFVPLMEPAYETMQFDVAAPTHMGNLLRSKVLNWACNLEVESCVKNATDLMTAYQQNNGTIQPDVRDTVYCTALRHGDYKAWEFLWSKYEESTGAQEKVLILNALGCTKNVTTLEAYLNMSIAADSEIRSQDATYVFSSVYAGNVEGVDVAFNFLKEHYKEMAVSYGGLNGLGKSITGLSTRLTTQQQVTEFEEFLRKIETEMEQIAVVADQAIESAKVALDWNAKNEGVIVDLLKKRLTGGASSVVATTLLIPLAVYLLFVAN